MPEPAETARRGVDPRGLRFAAGITSGLLLIVVFLGLTGLSTARVPAPGTASFGWFAYQPLADRGFGVLNGAAIDFAFVAGKDSAWLLAHASLVVTSTTVWAHHWECFMPAPY